MNIVIGKFGKSTLFDDKNWISPGGGDNEPSKFYCALARYHPDWNFYMIGKSDLKRIKPEKKKQLIPHNNIIDVWTDLKEISDQERIEYVSNFLKNIPIDIGIIFQGPQGCVNIPNKIKVIQKRKIGQLAKVLEMFLNYCGPMVWYLNESNIPYFTIVPDARYHPGRARDLFNISKAALSQYNKKDWGFVKHIESYENQDELKKSTTPLIYAGIETTCLYQMNKPDISKIPKSEMLSILMNEGGNGGDRRGPFLQEFILDNSYLDDNIKNTTSIYGIWKQDWHNKYSQFKGPIKVTQINDFISKSKYTLLGVTATGWITAKFWESILNGVIPFMFDYDTQHHSKVREFLWVKSPKDFAEKIFEVEKDPELYKDIINELQGKLKDDFFNGKHINNISIRTINKILNIDIPLVTDNDIKNIDSKINISKPKTLFDLVR